MNPEITKIIDQYLAGELSEKDRQIFEERLNSNPKLQEEVALQKDVVAGIKRSAQRVKIKQTRRNYFRSRLLKFGTIGLSSIALVGLVSYFAVSMLNSTIEPLSEELKSLLDKDAQFERIDAQYFQIPEEGGVVMSEKGVLLSVPKNAFLKNGQPYSGETIIQFQEAMDAEDIVTSGLSTMSGDRLLETQGMFSLRSYTKDGEELEVNPDVGVYAQAPVDEYKTGMQLFTGEKDASGNVDWQNPEPLYKLPVPVDMSELDFYPTEFEPYLDEQNWKKSKKSRDSLYLSFEDYCASEERGESERYMIGFDLYGNNCSTCHYIDKNATGPALRNARALWRENAEKPDLLYTWVRNWEKAALSSKWPCHERN